METNSKKRVLSLSPMDKIADVKHKIDKLDHERDWLERKIEQDRGDLEKSITGMNTTCPIKKKEYWISFLNQTDIEGTFAAVYADIVSLKDAMVKALQSGFNNSKGTLELLKKLADYELDLFKIIDESELDSAELSELFANVLKDTDKKDKTIAQLFKQTQDRALRLKERMDTLRIETNKRMLKWIILGSVITITLSLAGSILIHLYL